MAETDVRFRPLGRYRIVERLGAGGMAEVFRAVVDGPAGFARSVVVKRLLPQSGALQPAAREALLTEARLCSLLHHPGIVQVYELDEEAGEYFLVMELVDGEDLGNILRTCIARGVRMPPGVACHLVNEVAQALAYAHALTDDKGQRLGLIHRDISPSNIMISKSGGVKLLDFGIAKVTADERTRTGTLKGKIPYMSPEQADGRRLDHRSDIFSLGVVLYECLVSQRLFPREAELHTLRLVRQANVSPPSNLRPELEPEIDRVVMKMLARAVADRPQSCEEVVAALRPLVQRHGGDATALARFVAELGDTATSDDAVPEVALPAPPLAATGSTGGAATNSNIASRPGTQAFAAPRRSRWRHSRWAVVPLLGVLALWWRQGRPPRATIVPTSTGTFATHEPAPPATEAPAPPRPATVHLRVVGQAHAHVRIDGRDVGELPIDLELPARRDPRTVTVSAPGCAPWSERVAADTNNTLSVRLSPLVKREARPRRQKRPPVAFDPESPLPP
ncbi:MAG: Serine/threonine-protein kinase Pkn6 [Myxococcales bacterium]|nr:Serine/threonine-protein kinase Pkn6 [Myxococcales bacterium]